MNSKNGKTGNLGKLIHNFYTQQTLTETINMLPYQILVSTMVLQCNQEQHVGKSVVICTTQLAGGLLLKLLKYFEFILNIFEFSYVKEIVELVYYVNKFS